MSLYFRLFRFQILLSSVAVLLVGWIITASIIALRKNTQFKVIYATPTSVEILDEKSTKADNIFLQNFLYAYVSYCYNYDAARFVPNVSKCGDFMNPRLWASKQEEIKNAINSLKREPYVLSTFIDGTPQVLSNGDIELYVKSTKTVGSAQTTLRIRITMTIKKIPLVLENMSHYEVESAKEENI